MPDSIKEAQLRLGLNNRGIASLCRVTERTVERWRQGSRQVPETVLAFLSLILFLIEKYPKIWEAYNK